MLNRLRSHITPIILLLAVFSLGLFAIQSSDLFMYLALARHYFETGNWPSTDIFLYSRPGTELIFFHQWLSYFTFYGLWNLGGYTLLIVFKAFIIAMTFGWILYQNRQRTWRWYELMIFLLALHAASFRFIERGSLFSDFFLMGLCIFLLKTKSVSIRTSVILSLWFLMWIQFHPGYLVGLLMLGAWLAWQVWKSPKSVSRAWFAVLLVPFALLLNPRGLSGALYPIEFGQKLAPVLSQYVFEWMPTTDPRYLQAPEFISFWILSVVSLGVWIRSRGWEKLPGWWLMISVAAGASAVRFVPWASLVLALCCLELWPIPKKVRAHSDIVAKGLLSTVAIITLIIQFTGYPSSSGHRRPELALDPTVFPTTTLDFLAQKPLLGRLYAPQSIGDYLIWLKKYPVFAHGFMTDPNFISESVLLTRTYEDFLLLAQRYSWSMLLVDKTGTYKDLYQVLKSQTAWQIVAEDEATYLIYKLQ